jgi:hypothetical protein
VMGRIVAGLLNKQIAGELGKARPPSRSSAGTS